MWMVRLERDGETVAFFTTAKNPDQACRTALLANPGAKLVKCTVCKRTS